MTREHIVSLVRAGAAIVALLVGAGVARPAPGPSEREAAGVGGIDDDRLAQELAERFAVVERLFGRFNSVEASRELLRVLESEDAVGFDQLVGDLKLPLAGKCWWAHEMLRTAAELDAPLVTECWLREDMSWSERRLYLLIVRWYNPTDLTFEEREGHVFVAPGPFLETLKAYGLVHCESRPSHVLFLRPIVSKPFRFCLGEVPR